MTIKQVVIVIGLCTLLSGCFTGSYNAQSIPADTSPTGQGVRYLLGRGVAQNNAKAFAYFSEAANRGDPFAQNELAYLYAAGKGTARDYTKAFFWYQKAAAQGLASAQYNLGLFYLHGLGTPINKTEAMIWFKKSAALKFEPAINALAEAGK